MLRNYLTTSIRDILRHKGYSFLNIAGLAVGLACAFFIVLWIQDEVSTDRFHESGDRMYSVMRHSTFGGNKGTTRAIPKPLAAALVENYPEVENAVLISWEMETLLFRENNSFRPSGRWVGPDFFKVFSYPLALGDKETALRTPESIVLSADLAQAYFGTNWRTRNDILGSTLTLGKRLEVAITGVFEAIPANSTLKFEFVVPIEEYTRRNDWVESWSNNGLHLVARLVPGTDLASFNAKIIDLVDEHVDVYETDLFFYPFSEMYLRSDFENGVLVGGRIDYVRIFGLVALVIIIIASINFMNLATARSAGRAREIGVRKSVGATRAILARQFMGESVLKAGLAFVISIVLIILLMPAFNSVTGKVVGVLTLKPLIWLEFAGIALVTGLLAGSYPALYLSNFNVIGVFRSNRRGKSRGAGLRKALVVVQFGLSIVLIVGTFTVYNQLSYIRGKDLGINRENVAMVDFVGGIKSQYDSFKGELMNVPGVLSVSSSNNNPLFIGNDTIGVQWDGKDPDDNTLFTNSAIGYDFVETMGIKMAAGRTFSEEFGTDSLNYIINWKAAAAMGMEDPVGQTIQFWEQEGTIIGVMEDFHMSSMYRPISPVIFRLEPENTGILFVRMDGDQSKDALAGLEGVYKRFNPEYPFQFKFMDEEFELAYRSEVIISSLSNIFAFVAIFIACLGLFGLASFTAEQRTREIGIRKVLGATVPGVVALLSREFLILVGGAFLVAAPIAYIMMNNWLNEFEYHTELGVGILAASGVAALVIAWLTVSYQAIKTAVANPVHALKSE
ncbi:MAG: ABC transporter permease [Bacteroidetes bacterium]|nr:ABC transporter permease [Bacteroidota bacterium]